MCFPGDGSLAFKTKKKVIRMFTFVSVINTNGNSDLISIRK